MVTRFAAALQDQVVDSALRDLIYAWRFYNRLLASGAPLKGQMLAESAVDDLIERLSLVLPDIPPHEEPPSEDVPSPPGRFALEMLEGGAWAVLYHGGRLIITPNTKEKVWETSVITGYRDVWNEEINYMMREPIHERQTFKTLNAALSFSCQWLRTWEAGLR